MPSTSYEGLNNYPCLYSSNFLERRLLGMLSVGNPPAPRDSEAVALRRASRNRLIGQSRRNRRYAATGSRSRCFSTAAGDHRHVVLHRLQRASIASESFEAAESDLAGPGDCSDNERTPVEATVPREVPVQVPPLPGDAIAMRDQVDASARTRPAAYSDPALAKGWHGEKRSPRPGPRQQARSAWNATRTPHPVAVSRPVSFPIVRSAAPPGSSTSQAAASCVPPARPTRPARGVPLPPSASAPPQRPGLPE
jgi:hypothetical protein